MVCILKALVGWFELLCGLLCVVALVVGVLFLLVLLAGLMSCLAY